MFRNKFGQNLSPSTKVLAKKRLDRRVRTVMSTVSVKYKLGVRDADVVFITNTG